MVATPVVSRAIISQTQCLGPVLPSPAAKASDEGIFLLTLFHPPCMLSVLLVAMYPMGPKRPMATAAADAIRLTMTFNSSGHSLCGLLCYSHFPIWFSSALRGRHQPNELFWRWWHIMLRDRAFCIMHVSRYRQRNIPHVFHYYFLYHA